MSIEERLAVVETELKYVRSDVNEVKNDVKLLLASRSGSLALSALGKYIIPAAALALSVVALVNGS